MRRISILLIILLGLTMITPMISNGEAEEIKVNVNGELVKFDVQPTIIDGRTLVPVRTIFEKLGLEVGWDDETRTVIGKNNGMEIKLPVGNKKATKNGLEIELDVPSSIIEGRTLVPVRFIAESLGAEVDWDEETKTVIISENILKKKLDEKVTFNYDIKVFTIYSFMNYTGYDVENNKAYHEIRGMVRKDLKSKDINLSDNNYYKNRKSDFGSYEEALKYIGDEPNFELLTSKEKIKGDIKDLNKYLKEFYEKADIEELYEKYKPVYAKEINRLKEATEDDILNAVEYLRIDVEDIPECHIHFNPLNAFWRGGSTESLDGNVYDLIIGPDYSPNELNVTHEFLHTIINPILDELGKEIKEDEHNMSEVNNKKAKTKYGYGSWETIVDESFVRALSALVVYRNDSESTIKYHIESETNDGFVMTQYIYDRFTNDYDDFDGTLKEFIKNIVEDY